MSTEFEYKTPKFTKDNCHDYVIPIIAVLIIVINVLFIFGYVDYKDTNKINNNEEKWYYNPKFIDTNSFTKTDNYKPVLYSNSSSATEPTFIYSHIMYYINVLSTNDIIKIYHLGEEVNIRITNVTIIK